MRLEECFRSPLGRCCVPLQQSGCERSIRDNRDRQSQGNICPCGQSRRLVVGTAARGWRQPSHSSEVVAAGAWPKEPGGSTAPEERDTGSPRALPSCGAMSSSAEPLAAQTCPALLQAAPPCHSQAGARSPAEGNWWQQAANPPRYLHAPAAGGRAPLPPHGPAKTPRGTLAKAVSSSRSSACSSLPQRMSSATKLQPSRLTQPACCAQHSCLRRAACASNLKGNPRCVGWKEPLECSAPTAPGQRLLRGQPWLGAPQPPRMDSPTALSSTVLMETLFFSPAALNSP